MYYFVERDAVTGAPALPEGEAFRFAVEPRPEAGWAVFELTTPNPPQGVEAVPDELEALLLSARGYPPALALARQKLARDARLTEGDELPEREEFALRLCGLLEERLVDAPRLGHLLARSIDDDSGHRKAGAFYWLVGYDPRQDVVRYVSESYSLHEAPAGSFIVDGRMLFTLVEQQILAACADDAELFYFPFAAVNYGGQVSRREDGTGRSRYEDDGEWPIAFDGATIAGALERLVRGGLMRCWRLGESGGEREELYVLSEDDLEAYDGYECLTFHDHTEALGYGPHSFITTDSGLKAIGLPPRREDAY